MVKKKLTLIITCLLFCFAQGTFAQSKKKKRADKNAPAKVEAKAPESKDGKKEPKPYKKVSGINIADTMVSVFIISFILCVCAEKKKLEALSKELISDSICSRSSKLF